MRQKIHHILYLAGLLSLVVGLTTSHFLMSLSWVVLGVNWLLEGRFREKFQGFRNQRLLHLYLLLFAFFIVGLLWSSNLGSGLDYLRKRLPILFVPLAVLTSQPLKQWEYRSLLKAYVATLFVVSVIGLVRLATIPNLPYRDIVPFISNIRYCLNLCVAACLLLYALPQMPRAFRWVAVPMALYFMAYLLLLQSYTGIAVLLVVGVMSLIVYRHRLRKALWIGALSLLLGLTAGLSVCALYYVHKYFAPSELALQPLEEFTPSGHPYLHKADSVIECGNYVQHYLCYEEMDREWAKLSRLPLDSVTPAGYPVRATLIRYLNVTSGRKDSAAVASLTPADVQAIEQGVANPYYLKKLSLRRMCYTMCFEYDCGRRHGSIVGFSMLQRIELWKAGARAFLQHPLFGTGTGDYLDEVHRQLALMDSPIDSSTWRTHTHSQYLTFLIMFGAVGFLLLGCAFLFTLRRLPCRTHFPYLLITVILLISMLTENTLDTIGGYMMCAFFPSFFAKHYPPKPCSPTPCFSSTPSATESE